MKDKSASEYIDECSDLLLKYFKGDNIEMIHWLTTKNPHLGNAVPFHAIIVGRGHKVLEFIRCQIEGKK